MYDKRTYREQLKQERWQVFTVIHKESDLWIGVDKAGFDPGMPAVALETVKKLRHEMDLYLRDNPEYAKSLIPCETTPDAPEIFNEMSAVARQSGIGPMSAVAGAVAQRVAEALKEQFSVKEIIVENGGDIYADIQNDMDVAVFAGPSPLSERVGLTIRADRSPLGICTSSGTVGPSLSFGKADAVMIVCRNCALADTYATAFANRIQTVDDILRCTEQIGEVDDILAAICIKDDKMGITGEFDLKIWK